MFHGADVEALRGCAAQVGSEAERLGAMVGTLQTAARSMQWQGEDAHEFRERLEQAVTDAEQVSDQLRGRGDELRSHADEQEQASSTEAAGGGQAGAAEYDDTGEAFIWWWEDGGKWPLQDRTDIRDDIPIDDPSEFGIAAMNQRGIPNCVTIALLGGLSEQDAEFFMNNLEQVSPGVYEVTLFENGRPVVHTIEGDVLPEGARGSDGRQNWMTLYEAALIQHGVLQEDGTYSGYSEAMIEAITGVPAPSMMVPLSAETDVENGIGGFYDYSDGVELNQFAAQYLHDQGYTVIFGTEGRTATDPPLVENHAYVMTGVDAEGNVVLENPWGAGDHYGGKNGDRRLHLSDEQLGQNMDATHVVPPSSEWARGPWKALR